MYREFERICDSLPGEVNLNTITTNEHAPDIEFKNRVIKERARSPIISFPFKKIPGQIIIEMFRFLGIWINQAPSYNGVSDVYSPQNIIMGQDLAYDKHCKFRFGSYVEAHEDRKIANETEERTVSCIYPGPLQNFRGAITYFP